MNKVIPFVSSWLVNRGYKLESDSLVNEKSFTSDWGKYPYSIRGIQTAFILWKNYLELNFFPKNDSIEITITYYAHSSNYNPISSLETYNKMEGYQSLLDTLSKEINRVDF